MRKTIVGLLAALLVLLAVLPCAAATGSMADVMKTLSDDNDAGIQIQTNSDTGFSAVIDDPADLLAGEYAGVMEDMMRITEYCNVGFVTYNGSSTQYALDKANEWAHKTFPGGTCTVFIIDMRTRHLDIWSSDDIYKTITTDKTYSITGNTYGYASKGQYEKCARETFTQIWNLLDGQKIAEPMRYISCGLIAAAAAILLAYLVISARMEQEVKVSMPEILTATAGVGAAIVAKKLTRVVHHESSSGGRGGGFGGGGGGRGGGFGGGGGGHGF